MLRLSRLAHNARGVRLAPTQLLDDGASGNYPSWPPSARPVRSPKKFRIDGATLTHSFGAKQPSRRRV